VSIEKKKSDGDLAPFDPSAHYVHPLARVKLKIRISSDQMSQTSRSGNGDSIRDSEVDDYTGGEEDGDWEAESRITRRRPQSKRPTRAKPALPFSPRKTRARKLLAIRDSDSSLSDQDSDDLLPPVRRSMRGRKATEIELDSDSDYVDAQTDAPNRRIKLIGPKKKLSRPRSVIPAYGRVRDIGTVDEDPFDNDDDKEILRLHRRMCEKCHEGPAHDLLATLKKRSKGKGKKRKRDTDDEFEWSDDEEKLRSLGGWVQWFVFSPCL
jgi:chromodomain-helicase-DNA-binding protein 4